MRFYIPAGWILIAAANLILVPFAVKAIKKVIGFIRKDNEEKAALRKELEAAQTEHEKEIIRIRMRTSYMTTYVCAILMVIFSMISINAHLLLICIKLRLL